MLDSILDRYRNLPLQVRASLWYLFCSFMQKGVNVLSTPVFTRLLSTTEYGEYEIFNSWYGIISIIVTLNLFYGVFTQGLIKYSSVKKEFSGSFNGLVTVLVFFWLLVYLLFSSTFNNLFTLDTFQVLCMFTMIWSTAIFSLWAAEKRVGYEYKNLVVLTILASILKPTMGIAFIIISEDKVSARILGITIAEFVCYSWIFIENMKTNRVFFSHKFWKYALMLNIPLLPHYLSQIVLNTSDRIMINKMVGSSSAGIYALAYSLSSVMLLFNSALSQTISPWIYQKLHDQRVQDISLVSYWCIIFIGFVNIVLMAFAPELVTLFAPPPYY